jgi:hypothetical protein
MTDVHMKRQSLHKVFTVHFVVRNTEDIFEFSTFRDLQTFCKEQHVQLVARAFNSREYIDDRDYVEQLPAFHLYKGDEHLNTFYLTGNPLFEIRRELQVYKEKQMMKKRTMRQRMKAKLLKLLRS